MTRSFLFFASYREPGLGWFRIFGYGLHWKDTRRHKLTFSERNGFRNPHVQIGAWRFRFLGAVPSALLERRS